MLNEKKVRGAGSHTLVVNNAIKDTRSLLSYLLERCLCSTRCAVRRTSYTWRRTRREDSCFFAYNPVYIAEHFTPFRAPRDLRLLVVPYSRFLCNVYLARGRGESQASKCNRKVFSRTIFFFSNCSLISTIQIRPGSFVRISVHSPGGRGALRSTRNF